MLISKQTNINKEKFDLRYCNFKTTKLGMKNKLKIRWKTIKWILDNRKGNDISV